MNIVILLAQKPNRVKYFKKLVTLLTKNYFVRNNLKTIFFYPHISTFLFKNLNTKNYITRKI